MGALGVQLSTEAEVSKRCGSASPRCAGAGPGIIVEIRWCPAHKGISGDEKADECAEIAAEEADTRGVEWLSYSDRTEVQPMPLPRSLANLKREISEKKWVEARQWAGGGTSKTKYRMPKSQEPDGAVAGSTKRLASRFYQIKTGHCLDRTVPPTGRRTAPPRNAGGAGIELRPATPL